MCKPEPLIVQHQDNAHLSIPYDELNFFPHTGKKISTLVKNSSFYCVYSYSHYICSVNRKHYLL